MSRIVPSLAVALLAVSACFPSMARTLVDVTVVDRDDGRPLQQYRHGGERWLPGMPGHRYAVRLANTSSERVLVVLSVDGVNAVTGEDADPSQAGYVLGPWQSTEITGWRKSLDEVAQFHFTRLPDSYAARTGRPDNVGVIGVAVFRERSPPLVHVPRRPYPVRPQARMDTGDDATAPAPAAAEASAMTTPAPGSVARQRIGTGHGTREWDPVSRTAFVRAGARPAQLTELRYDTPRRLVALGILPRGDHWHRPPVAQVPRAFPGDFVPDPR